MVITWLPWAIVILVLLIAALVYLRGRQQPRTQAYHVKVKFAHGIKTKLVLNETQWEQFRAWLYQPDGIYDIGDDKQSAWLDRSFLVSVEMKQK